MAELQMAAVPRNAIASAVGSGISVVAIADVCDPKTDPLAEWRTMNRAMTENPPELRLDKLVGLFARIGVGPGQDVDKMDDATNRRLARAAVDGRKLLKAAIDSGQLGTRVNNWNIPPRTYGRAGLVDDFLLRGSLQCMGGIIANEPEEAVYYNTTKDGAGQTFDGAKKYTLHFPPGQLPKVNAFWSLTMYDTTFNFTDNALNRYSLGDRTQGLKRDADGVLTIYIQHTSPGEDKESNWLPSMRTGAFMLILRTRRPSPYSGMLVNDRRCAAGEMVDEKDVRKHRNHVARMLQLLPGDASYALPPTVQDDMSAFIEALSG
jgi:hypothetical protein